jgi:hypothetical protein
MNKQALSLVEVLVSVMLISVVIVSILQIKENNLNFLDKTKDRFKYISYISMVALDESKKLEDKNIYLDKVIDFKDDDIRKELKLIKIKLKDEQLKPIKLGDDEYKLSINIKKTKLTIEDKIKKEFYRFSLVDEI